MMAYEIQELPMSALAISTAAQLANLRNNLNTDVYLTSDIDLSATMMAASNWAASTFYRQWVVVKVDAQSKIYRCLADHTSGTFADDLAAGKWEYIRDYVPNYSSSSTYPVGAEVVHNNNIYQCVIAITTPEVFDAAKWMQLGTTAVGWLAIAQTFALPFTGSFNGGNCIIKNLFCKNTIEYQSSLFGVFSGKSVINISLFGFCIINGIDIACFSSLSESATVFRNVYVVKSYLTAISTGTIGGIACICHQSIFRNCSVNAVFEPSGEEIAIGALCAVGLFTKGSKNILTSGRIIGGNYIWASGISSTEAPAKIENAIINISFEGNFETIAGITSVEGDFENEIFNEIRNVLNISTRNGTASTVYGIAPTSAQVVNCYAVDTFGGIDTDHHKTAAELKQRETFAGWNFKRDWYLPADDNWVEKLFPPNDGYPCLRTLWEIEAAEGEAEYGLLGPIRGLLGGIV